MCSPPIDLLQVAAHATWIAKQTFFATMLMNTSLHAEIATAQAGVLLNLAERDQATVLRMILEWPQADGGGT